jgi:hypothetical protein
MAAVGKLPLVRNWQRMVRRRRLRQFVESLQVSPDHLVLDVGGTIPTWLLPEMQNLRAVLLNLRATPIEEALAPRLQSVKGDACNLAYEDGAFEIVFCNSVIEHVGTYENQKKMAAELRRVGGRLWIQTPARSFFVEPHYMTPFVHWFPKSIRRKLLRWFTLWGLLTRPSKQRVEAMLAELRLLSYDEMKQLFPDCEIRRERFFGLTKSYIAVR